MRLEDSLYLVYVQNAGERVRIRRMFPYVLQVNSPSSRIHPPSMRIGACSIRVLAPLKYTSPSHGQNLHLPLRVG